MAASSVKEAAGDMDTQIQNWLELLRAGNATARDQIINYSCERVGRLTKKMLANYPHLRRWEQTDDVLQVALLRLHRSLKDVQPESVRQFFGLAAMQVRRTLIDLARHHFGPEGQAAHHFTAGRGVAADDGDGPILKSSVESCEPETLDSWTRFHEAVETLPNDEREVFSLLWYGGMTQTEAASVLGVVERTVRRRWESARCLLYEAMRGERPE